MSKKDEINLQALDLDRNYTIEEFEMINKQLKNKPIEINKQPVDLFEYKNKKLTPMPQCTILIEAVVAQIVSQLDRWNIQTHQNGIITSSQGGFNFKVGGKMTIDAPDVAFTPRRKYDSLTEEQRQTFKGEPFTPTFVVEVGNVAKPSDFRKLDAKFKNDYFAEESAVQLGWLIDPINNQIYVYRRGAEEIKHGWNDVSGDEVLPKFTLKIWKIDQVIKTSESSESSKSKEPSSLNIQCPECTRTFNSHYFFMEHYEDVHARNMH